MLLQFLQNKRLFLAEELYQEGLRMKRADPPPFEVLTPEVAKVESDDKGRLGVDSSGQHVAILFIVCHLGKQWFVAADPCFAEVGAQFRLEMSG